MSFAEFELYMTILDIQSSTGIKYKIVVARLLHTSYNHSWILVLPSLSSLKPDQSEVLLE